MKVKLAEQNTKCESNYFTVGKIYDLIVDRSDSFNIKNDFGMEIFCLKEDSWFGTWEFIDDQPQEPTKEGSIKYDADKAPLMEGCIERFPLALQQIALVSEYGQRKYGTYDGWEKVSDAFNRYNNALGRHTVLRSSEGEYDLSDSGLPHLAQRAWNALATLELALREGKIDLVPGNDIVDGQPVLNSNGAVNVRT